MESLFSYPVTQDDLDIHRGYETKNRDAEEELQSRWCEYLAFRAGAGVYCCACFPYHFTQITDKIQLSQYSNGPALNLF